MVLQLVLKTGKTRENFKMGPFLKYLFKSIDEDGRERPTLDGTGVGTMPVSRGATVGDEAARSLMGRPFAGAMPVRLMVPPLMMPEWAPLRPPRWLPP